MRCRVVWILLALNLTGCASRRVHFPLPERRANTQVTLETTGYCACGDCCGWKRSWWRLGKPVVASGPYKGQPKAVGVTASGSRAQPGVIAADTSVFPFGTILWVPGYGWGRVEDRGGAIRGKRLDLFFETHREALEWGRRTSQVQVWYGGR